jgi:pantoate--beta-alanine ligase
VANLLNIVKPDAMYLGQKDAQQVAVLSRMVEDLNFPTAIRVVPTVREADGMAMSSRNVYLSAQQRREAPVLYKALREAVLKIRAGQRRASRITGFIHRMVTRHSYGKIQYVACVDAVSLKPLKILNGKVLIA